MDKILGDLAERLHALRVRSNRAGLQHVLASAKILLQARDIAQRDFGRWVREKAHMQYDTARRYLRVNAFVEANHDLNSEFASLSLAKLYALSSLDSDSARRFLTHREAFSKPLDRLTDVEFLREFRQRFPRTRPRRTREHVYQEISAAIARLKRALVRGVKYAARMTELQRERIARELEAAGLQAGAWREKRGTG